MRPTEAEAAHHRPSLDGAIRVLLLALAAAAAAATTGALDVSRLGRSRAPLLPAAGPGPLSPVPPVAARKPNELEVIALLLGKDLPGRASLPPVEAAGPARPAPVLEAPALVDAVSPADDGRGAPRCRISGQTCEEWAICNGKRPAEGISILRCALAELARFYGYVKLDTVETV